MKTQTILVPGHPSVKIQCDHVETNKYGHVVFFNGSWEEWAYIPEHNWKHTKVKARLINGVLITYD